MRYPLFLLSLLFITFGCRKAEAPVEPPTAQVATGRGGVVSAAHPLATLAGQQMLDKGGNAVDAAVAAAFALSVVEPGMSGLGGRLQAIVRLPDGAIRGVDATTQAPLAYDTSKVTKDERYGYHVIGIPGVVAGLTKLLNDYGSLPRETVMAPAIRYAEEGFKVLPRAAERYAAVEDILLEFDGARQYFLKPDGSAYDEGEKLVQEDLAETLRLIAEGGRDAFYEGAIAKKIAADMRANGGLLTMEDLADYEARDARVVNGTYRGHDLHGLWLPSYGAITIEILHILENFPLGEMRGAAWANAHYRAIEMAYRDRQKQLKADSMARVLTSKEYAASLAEQIDLSTNGEQSLGMSSGIPESWREEMGHTTHLSAADAEGRTIALTQSLGPLMGSKVASPDLGFLYAVTLGGYLGVYKAGQRANSHISPFLITKNGQPFLGLGAAGGSRIPSAITSVSSRVIDHGMTLDAALAAPRVHPHEDSLFLETHPGAGWKDEVVEALEAKGVAVKELENIARFGRVQAVQYDPETQTWTGAADPDWEGSVAGVKQ